MPRIPPLTVSVLTPHSNCFNACLSFSPTITGRMATYRDFAIVQVDNAEVLTQRQWRERGNQSIFAETMQHKRRHKAGAAGLDSGLGASGSVSSLPGE